MTLLELHGIGIEYGAIRALAEVDYTVAPGEVVGLIGDNGAGKSTLVKIIAGNFPPTRGTMRFGGRLRLPASGRLIGAGVTAAPPGNAVRAALLFGCHAFLDLAAEAGEPRTVADQAVIAIEMPETG